MKQYFKRKLNDGVVFDVLTDDVAKTTTVWLDKKSRIPIPQVKIECSMRDEHGNEIARKEVSHFDTWTILGRKMSLWRTRNYADDPILPVDPGKVTVRLSDGDDYDPREGVRIAIAKWMYWFLTNVAHDLYD